MHSRYLLLATAAWLFPAGMALAAEVKYETKTTIEKDDDGSYERKDVTTRTDAEGNSIKLEKKVGVDVAPEGGFERTTTTKRVSDPKGFLNKHVVETTTKREVKQGETVTTVEKKINGKNVLGERDKYKSTTKIVEDAQGNYDEKMKVTKKDDTGKVTYEKRAVVDVEADGNIDKSTTTKEVRDPKGLLNKQTMSTANSQTIEGGVVKNSHEIKVDGKLVDSASSSQPRQ